MPISLSLFRAAIPNPALEAKFDELMILGYYTWGLVPPTIQRRVVKRHSRPSRPSPAWRRNPMEEPPMKSRSIMLVVCAVALALSVGYAGAITTTPGPDTLKVDYYANANT